MLYSRISTFLLIFIFSYSFSQEANKKSTLIKKIEGITISYVKINNGSDYIFHINNESGNTAIISWDVKIYYSETNSKEIHKEYKSLAFSKEERPLLQISKTDNNKSLFLKSNKKIERIEIHNFEFKADN